jgi:integrase
MATIRPRGDSWEARIRRKGWPVTCRTFDTKFDAEKWAREIESEMDRGVFVSRAEAESTTLAEALDRYETDYLPRLAHPDREILRIKGLKRRVLAARFLAAIRTKDVADFIKEREAEGVSPNTIRLDLALLSRLFEVAASDWGMESLGNPVRRVSRPKLPSGRTRRLEAGEEEKLLDACPSLFRELIQLALETAMRREELQTLEWSQVDFGGKTAHLPKTKNGDARTVPLSPAALDILKSMVAVGTTAPPPGVLLTPAISARGRTHVFCRRNGASDNARAADLAAGSRKGNIWRAGYLVGGRGGRYGLAID